jgi:hypothetical protein
VLAALLIVIGFDSTAASMAFGGRRNPAELALGTAFGAVGPLVPGSTGFFRGLVSSSALNGLMNWLLGGGPLQMGGTSK